MKKKSQISKDDAILYKKITFDPKDATEDDIYAFDGAENWAKAMTELAKKLQQRAIAMKKKGKKKPKKTKFKK